MDFQQFVTEYFSDKVDRNPSSLANDNMQELLDLSRRQDLDSRQGQLNESEDSEEITEVDAPPVESASPARMQEPAMDSAFRSTPLADESEVLETGPVEFKTSQQVEHEVEYHEQLEARKSALADEDIIPAELTQLPDAEEGLSIEGISIRHESEILGAEDVDFDLVAALSTVDNDLMGEGKHIEFNPQDYDIPELSAIPDDINKEMNAVPDALNLDGLRLTELGRRT